MPTLNGNMQQESPKRRIHRNRSVKVDWSVEWSDNNVFREFVTGSAGSVDFPPGARPSPLTLL